ncbi:MAG: C-GCAxxG-C-C family protein [Oscillospiraceae bacterium]|jgi:C_GCAxxG_C_C family probable redox protein|nr:C-GCAxxG-C-C family protein [Oscillospiraceae bacterium]
MSEKTERANAYRGASFNCSQAVFAAFAEDYDVEVETALRISSAFGGGMRCGEVCGAATGGLMAIGAAKGQYIPGDLGAKADCGARAAEFMAEFRRVNGCLLCRDLLGVDTSTPEGHEKFELENMGELKCSGFIENAIAILERLGY